MQKCQGSNSAWSTQQIGIKNLQAWQSSPPLGHLNGAEEQSKYYRDISLAIVPSFSNWVIFDRVTWAICSMASRVKKA